MEQLIFIGIIVVFSMLEAAARKKRKAQSGGAPSAPDEPPEVWLPSLPRDELPSYDPDPFLDDKAAAGPAGADASSEGLIPTDVWEEIQALARGETQPARVPTRPTPSPGQARVPSGTGTRAPRAAAVPMPTKARSTPAPAAPRAETAIVPEHSLHLAHAKFGKPVQERLTGFAEDTSRQGLSDDGKAVREVLRRGGMGLRQAVLLQEILGPPVSLKDDPSAG